ncbi:putative ATP-dependent helicase-like protein [Hapsidospora chrysogenum ATCC 11550]|uniref:Putative ATP-dependent helicase-like protein n=1 Tax=Hapsidospora chrysogenum (strain ATCC 11550 / CBS 779.69 / DSM 880 / IAM 14645 / JCM 23072 / IMI 49137) TaxID=857340 RepID=A0A086SWB4_HAPC1|nr:putative ATP-dependent helicase-like protein [Hapsidospora chrysogenum ATCC 11550]
MTPDFSKSPSKAKSKAKTAVADALIDLAKRHSNSHPVRGALPLQSLGAAMVNERAPPKVPLKATDANPKPRLLDTDDEEDIISAMKNLSATKSSAPSGREPTDDPLRNHPRFGHATKMVSSRKQKANIFNQQTSRPEHHLGTVNRVYGPSPPTYKDRKAPPLPVFDSTPFAGHSTQYGDEVFYTDPAKASEDLKNLLEGNLDGDEDKVEEAEQKKEGEDAQGSKDPKSGVVDGLKVKLLPHQVEGVEWMRGRELGPVKRGKVPKGGILADDMGLGKTLQTIALILTNQKPSQDDDSWKKHYQGIEKTTLVVAPLALIRQWESEIVEKVAKSHQLKIRVHHGPNRTKRSKDLALYDVVVTTYQILVSEWGHASQAEDGVKVGCFGLHWWRVVLDEAHTIKNRNAKATKACCALDSEYRWCLSGTPMQNNLDELQSLIKFLRIRPYDNLKEWKEHIDLPMKNGKGHIAIRRLHSILQCFMKRRRKEILKEAGALNPGGKSSEDGKPSSTGFKVTERNVVMVSTEMSAAERKFYKRLEARADRSLEDMIGGKVSYASALTLLLRMRQACNHPKLVAGKLAKDKDALSTDSSQKSQDVDVDSMADMFAGMGIEATKSCSICGHELSSEERKSGKEICSECSSELDAFNNQGARGEETKPKKVKKKKKEKSRKENVVEAKKAVRRPRNRRAVVDSDDEEDGGSWLVPEDERGSLRLGKAGAEEDENAEGGGDSIGSEDSEDSEPEDQERSNLSFVVDDEAARKEKGYVSANENADSESDDDSLLSISAITKKMASQTLEDKPAKPESACSASETDQPESDSGQDDSDTGDGESDSGEEESGSDAEDSVVLEGDWDTKRYAREVEVVASAKIRELLRILAKEVDEHKFIVFSQFTSMLDLVEPFLGNEGFEYTRYDGSMKNDEREESLRRLRKDPDTRILLCSLKCGSLGLNLTAATRVVILEPFWNPFVEEQAIDRVHRLTQTVDVTIYRLTVANSIEERILELQEKKRLLAEQAIEGGMKKGAFKLGLNEIIDLFKPGHADNADSYIEGNPQDLRQAARDAAMIMRKKPAVKRQESEIYGRRW